MCVFIYTHTHTHIIQKCFRFSFLRKKAFFLDPHIHFSFLHVFFWKKLVWQYRTSTICLVVNRFSAIKWQRMGISIFGLYLHSLLNMDIFMSQSGKDIKIFFFTIKNLFFFPLNSENRYYNEQLSFICFYYSLVIVPSLKGIIIMKRKLLNELFFINDSININRIHMSFENLRELIV